MPSKRTFRVTWEPTVTAGGIRSAARAARAAMIDPARTEVTLRVQPLDATGWPKGEAKTIVVQDPDRSNEETRKWS